MPRVDQGCRIEETHREQFKEQGYCVFEDAISEPLLSLLRTECGYFVERENRKLDALGVDVLDITHRDQRYFASFCLRERPSLARFLFGDTMESICRAFVGENAYLFYDMYVVKGANAGMKLGWHQDSGYVNANGGDVDHEPYVTCWCPLDDVDEDNGTIYVLPYGESGIRTWVPHVHDPETNDWVGYDGPLPGVPICTRAGSIVVFSSVTLHRSGANRTPHQRRAFLAQYSPEPVLTADGTMLWGNGVPFLRAGRSVVGAPPEFPLRIDVDPEAGPKSAGGPEQLTRKRSS
jgi:ectoine hydroxylase-related dioxygenase (phytanoyl-CoA dioxygenase family)